MDVNNGDKEANVQSIARHLSQPSHLKGFLHVCNLLSSAMFMLSGYYVQSAEVYVYITSILTNQIITHFNIHNLTAGLNESVERFFLLSCLSTSLVFFGLILSNQKSKVKILNVAE
ncbi:hypothetical protein GJ496_003721 [Pomphorhynchus laevis]|nr:hypothetical protein GJ496_003721 [Pomphorhynchus laevis]